MGSEAHGRRKGGNRAPSGLPVDGSKQALALLKRAGFEVIIFTARPAGPTRRWLKQQGYDGLYRCVSNVKWPATVIFDDRAIRVRKNDGKDFVAQVEAFVDGQFALPDRRRL